MCWSALLNKLDFKINQETSSATFLDHSDEVAGDVEFVGVQAAVSVDIGQVPDLRQLLCWESCVSERISGHTS